jgi:hypothetical protein
MPSMGAQIALEADAPLSPQTNTPTLGMDTCFSTTMSEWGSDAFERLKCGTNLVCWTLYSLPELLSYDRQWRHRGPTSRTFSIRHVGITDWRELKTVSLICQVENMGKNGEQRIQTTWNDLSVPHFSLLSELRLVDFRLWKPCGTSVAFMLTFHLPLYLLTISFISWWKRSLFLH